MLKAVLKLDLHDDKEKKKAMKKASGFAGVESIAMDMKDKKLTVAGAMDPVELAEKLRKLFPTEIVSVGPAKEEKKDDKKKDGSDKKKDDNKGNQKEPPKDSKPDPPTVYPFPYGLYRPPPPPPQYYGYYLPPPPPPPQYYYGGYVSVEEDPNACVIC